MKEIAKDVDLNTVDSEKLLALKDLFQQMKGTVHLRTILSLNDNGVQVEGQIEADDLDNQVDLKVQVTENAITTTLQARFNADRCHRRFPNARTPNARTPNARTKPVIIVPGRPRKRKRQAVDNIRKLTHEQMMTNLLSVSDTLRDQIIDVPLRLSAQELFNNPSLPAFQSRPFIDMWRQNAVPRIISDEEMRGDLYIL